MSTNKTRGQGRARNRGIQEISGGFVQFLDSDDRLYPKRDKLQAHLEKRGIQTLIHYPMPPHLQEAYRELELSNGAFPITETIHREVLSLPIYPNLTKETIETICMCPGSP